MTTTKQLAALALCILTFNIALAKCVYPVPDGGVVKPSKANIEGHIATISGTTVTLKSIKNKQHVQVSLGSNQSIFTAFGGDDSIKALKPGQYAWVWLEGCKSPKSGEVAKAAYFQIYSADPKDQPIRPPK